ncbi:unannotated protein [freshwater metagenome]|uniref:Unannotated protein n=1 Tax=freshwater metagenome TaxID=449393 RepID=A0A6J7QC07_9ZZZZ
MRYSVTVRSMRIECRNASKCSRGMSQRRTVSTTALHTGSSLWPRLTSLRKASPHVTSQSAFCCSVRVLDRSSTISSA